MKYTTKIFIEKNNIFLNIFPMILLIACTSAATKGFHAKFYRMDCHGEPDWFVNATCTIKAKSRNVRVANMYVKPLKPLTLMYGVGRLFKRLNGWRPWIVHGNGSICDALGGKFNPIMKIFKTVLNKYTNVNHSCPIDHPLISKNLQLDVLDMGLSIFPEGTYRWDLLMYEHNMTFIGFIKSFFEVSEKKQ